MGPAIVGTLLITGAAALDGDPARRARRRSTSTSTASSGRLARLIRTMADVMTGVPSIVMGLFIYIDLGGGASQAADRLRRRAGAGLPDAAGGDPQHRGDAPAGPRRTAPGEPGAGRPAAGAPPSRWCCRRRCSGITSGALLAIARAAGETAPLVVTIGLDRHASTGTCSPAATPRCRRRSSATPSQPFAAAQDRAWGAALTLVVIVLVIHPRRSLDRQPLRRQGALSDATIRTSERRTTPRGDRPMTSHSGDRAPGRDDRRPAGDRPGARHRADGDRARRRQRLLRRATRPCAARRPADPPEPDHRDDRPVRLRQATDPALRSTG